MWRCSQTRALIISILPASAEWVLTSRSWTSGGDDVGVLGHDRGEQVGPADRVEDGLARPIAAGQDQAERGAPGPAARLPAPPVRWAVVRVRITSSRSPGTITRVSGWIRSSMWAGSIAPIATPPITRSRSGPGWIVSPWTPSRIMARVGFDRIGR